MARFITLSGRKQVGKDTSAQYIKRMIEQNSSARVYIVHFADALKKACSAIFGIPLEDMETETGKKRPTDVRWPHKMDLDGWVPDVNGQFMTVREILQFVGTELFRSQMDPDVWVKSVYRKKYREGDIVVVADCRFPNEADFARERGLLISVLRDTGLASDGHASETSLDGYDNYHYTINNNGSFEALRRSLESILQNEGFLVEV